MNGLRGGDELEKVVKDIIDLNKMEIIEPHTLFDYAYDIILIEFKNDVEESARKPIQSSCNMRLVINKNKTNNI